MKMDLIEVIMETPPRAWGRRRQIAEPFLEKETPPRAWGRPGQGHVAAETVGNTPTGVGKTNIKQ